MKYIIQLALTTLFLSQNAFGAGFALIEQSVSLMGTAYAGAAASACDASTIYFNPAGMSKLCHQEVVFGAHAVLPSAKFDNQGSLNFSGGLLTGGNGGDAGESAVVAHLSYVKPLGDRFHFGLTINTPFGLATEYDDTWVGRYHAIRSELLTININPSFSVKLKECLSLGVGFSAMWIDAKLTNAVDAQALVGGPPPVVPDIKATLKGDSWGYGFNVGLLADIGACSRIGVHYRSQVKQNLKGTVDFDNVFSALQSAFIHSKAHSDVTLPSTFSISGVHDINCRWSILGDFTWTKWNEIQALVFHFDDLTPALQTKQITLKWKNAERYSIGTIYRFNPCTEFRTGFAYDKSPASSPEFTSARIPDADRFWLTFGFGYQWNECTHLDFGYAHLWAKDPKIYQQLSEENLASGALRGEWRAYTDIISLQVRYFF